MTMGTSVRKMFYQLLFFSVFYLLFSVCSVQDAHANVGKGPAQKLARGIVYIVTSPFQIPKEIIQTAAEADPVWLAAWKGFAQGGGTGLYQMGRQGVAGFWDIFTFLTPAGRDWEPLYKTSLFPEV